VQLNWQSSSVVPSSIKKTNEFYDNLLFNYVCFIFLKFVENHSKPLASLIDSLTHGEERGTAGRVRLGNDIFKSVYADHASHTAR
jgi:hypothetical protein